MALILPIPLSFYLIKPGYFSRISPSCQWTWVIPVPRLREVLPSCTKIRLLESFGIAPLL